ncbi:MAG: nuclear transport factor 2 family protein [Verrucomicrobiota bacterium]
MNKTLETLLLLALLATGCATTRPENLDAPHPAEQAQIQNRLQEIFDAATKKDFTRLDSYHFYGPKFTKFATESPDRQDAAAAREAEHAGLEAVTGMKINVENLKIDVLPDVGVATFLMRYSFQVGTNAVERQAKGTLVLVNDRGSWKIVHEHFSALKPNP